MENALGRQGRRDVESSRLAISPQRPSPVGKGLARTTILEEVDYDSSDE